MPSLQALSIRIRNGVRATIAAIRRSALVKLAAMLIAGFVALASAVKAYREVFPSTQRPVAPPPVTVVVPTTTMPPQPVLSEPTAKPAGGPYANLWQCVVPPAVARPFPPASQALDDALLYWSSRDPTAHHCLIYLLRAGASPDATDPTGSQGTDSGPALHAALARKQWVNALTLLRAGAQPNLRTAYRPESLPKGRTALDVARYAGADEGIRNEIVRRGGVSDEK